MTGEMGLSIFMGSSIFIGSSIFMGLSITVEERPFRAA